MDETARPTKRMRLSPPASAPSARTSLTQAKTLLALATRSLALSSSHAPLSRTGDSSYARRHIALAVACLRTAIALVSRARAASTSTASSSSGAEHQSVSALECDLFECTARVRLAATLLACTEKHEQELEALISRGLAIASSTNTSAFFDLRQHLVALQASSALSRGAHKQARQITRRNLTELASASASANTGALKWRVQHHLTLYSLALAQNAKTDYAEALSNLRNVEQLTKDHGEARQVYLASKILIARLALSERQLALASDECQEIGAEVETATLPRSLVTLFALVRALALAQLGRTRDAKDALKRAHELLDLKERDADEDAGLVRLVVGNGAEVYLAAPPRQLVYTFAFLASVAVHRDPYGGKPRSKLFAKEGLRLVERAKNDVTVPSHAARHDLADTDALARIRCSLLLFSAELALMRSSFDSTTAYLRQAISCARSNDALWEAFHRRITLVHGALAAAKGNDERARTCFRVLALDDRDEDEIQTLAQVSLVLLEISAGKRVRLLDSGTSTTTSTLELDSLATRAVAACARASSPPLTLAGDVVRALASGAISRAKDALRHALNVANDTVANHAKALVLALLSNLFLHTRNDQAHRMLVAALQIARGMAPTDRDSQAPTPLVGNARLGLWVSERLLDMYKAAQQDKVDEHLKIVEAHTEAVQSLE